MKTTNARGTRALGIKAAALALATGLLAPGGDLAAQSETVRLRGDRIGIWNLAGRVEVVRGTGSEVVVRITRGGSDAGRLSVETGPVGNRESLRIVYPDDRVVYEGDGDRGWGSWNTNVSVRSDGTFGGGGDGRRVRISGSGRGLEAWADLRIEVPEGRDVSVYVAVGRMSAQGVTSDLHLDSSSGEIEVSDVRGRVSADTGSGSVRVRGVEGSLDVDTGSGSIRVEGVRGSEVRLDTGSGSVSASDVTTSDLLVDTGSGGVDLLGVESPSIRVDTGSGSVEIEVVGAVEFIEVDTGSGSVTLRLPDPVSAMVELDTGSGGIDLDFPIEVRRMQRDHVEGRIGGGDGTIVVDTGSGSIRLLRR